MEIIVCGDGPMGRSVADELREAGHGVRVLGHPPGGRHPADAFAGADVVHEFSTADAVMPNLRVALRAGCRRFVIGTTGWDHDRAAVDAALVASGGAAVVAPTFSPGATVLLELAGQAARLVAALGGYEPFVVEWHRSGKRDRPSGTASELVRRMETAAPRQVAVEVASIRAGDTPGMHLLGFDAAGETLELRLTARDRRCYAAGARLAGDWLTAARREPGIHRFESVVADLVRGSTSATQLERITA